MGPKKSVKFSREMSSASRGMTEWKPNQSKKPKDYYPDAAEEETKTANGATKDAPAAKSAVPGGKVVANKLEAI